MKRSNYSETLRRATMARAKNAALQRARIAAADAACASNLMADLRLGAMVAIGAFVFLMVVLG